MIRKLAPSVMLGLALWALIVAVVDSRVWATDDGWSCPAGTEHVIKLDDLSGPTFVVPTPPPGWEILAVVIKAATAHYLYAPVVPGQVLAVGHDISHAHLCKRRTPDPTTTSSSSTTILETTTTWPATTTTTTATSTPTTIPASTTTAPASTSTSSAPTTSVPDSTSTSTAPTIPTTTSSTSVATTTSSSVTTPTVPDSTSTSSPSPTLPVTGPTDLILHIAGIGALSLLLGVLILAARRS